MFNINRVDDYLALNFASELFHVEKVIQEFNTYLTSYGISNQTEFEGLIRKILIYVVDERNRNDEEKIVKCFIERLDRLSFKFIVEDEGDSSGYGELKDEIIESHEKNRMGNYSITQHPHGEIDFNDKGCCITLFYTFQANMFYHSDFMDDVCVITPGGDMTANKADEFRNLLIELFDSGNRNFLFDLKEVSSIDSVDLSVFFAFHNMLSEKYDKFDLKIENVNPDLMNLFKMTQLIKYYEIIAN